MSGVAESPTPTSAGEPLLAVEDLRVDVDGLPACDGLTLRTSGERVLVLGAPRALFEAACGVRPVMRGALRVRGQDAGDATRCGRVTGAPLEPALPPKWSVLEYVTWSSRLAGHSSADAKSLATQALELTQLGPMSATRLARVVGHARRGVVLAAALAVSAEVIILEDPLAGLAEEHARTWAQVIVKALDKRPFLVLAARISLTSPLAMSADEALVVSSSRLEAQGAPAEIATADRRFVARIHGPVDALAARLSEHGVRVEVQGAQLLLDLCESVSTAELLGIAAELDATVVEMLPVARALT